MYEISRVVWLVGEWYREQMHSDCYYWRRTSRDRTTHPGLGVSKLGISLTKETEEGSAALPGLLQKWLFFLASLQLYKRGVGLINLWKIDFSRTGGGLFFELNFIEVFLRCCRGMPLLFFLVIFLLRKLTRGSQAIQNFAWDRDNSWNLTSKYFLGTSSTLQFIGHWSCHGIFTGN